jgi:hypothetical protein
MSRRHVVEVVVLVLVLAPVPVAAQPDPLDEDREMARARFAADQATFAELARQQAEAARQLYRERMHEYEAGRIIPDRMLSAAVRLLHAEQAPKGEAGDGPVLELAWRRAWLAERFARSGFESGRNSITEYWRARLERLELQRSRAAQKNAESQTGTLADFLLEDEALPYARRLARFIEEAGRTDRAELDRERLAIARMALRATEDEIRRGRFLIERLFEETQVLVRAELAVRGEDDPNAVLEVAWQSAIALERIARARFDAGRIATAECLEQQFALARLGPAGRGGAAFMTAELLIQGDDFGQLRELARDRFDAEQMSPEQVWQAWREAARKVFQARFDELQTGLGGPYRLWQSSAYLARVEHSGRAEKGQAAILEASWRLAWQVDRITQGMFQMGRIAIAEAAETRIQRLAVEMELARLRERKPEK